MPQPWTMCSPCRSPKASIIARGGAAPPTVIEPHRGEIPLARVRVERLQDSHPDRRHAGGDRDRSCSTNAVEQALADRGAGPGTTCFAPSSVAREREAPRVRVEHRDDRAGTRRRLWMPRDAAVHRERVERDRAMRVEDALRRAGGAARVTHRRGRRLVRSRGTRTSDSRRVGEQVLVVDRPSGVGPSPTAMTCSKPQRLDELLGERPQHLVDDEHAVAARGSRCR